MAVEFSYFKGATLIKSHESSCDFEKVGCVTVVHWRKESIFDVVDEAKRCIMTFNDKAAAFFYAWAENDFVSGKYGDEEYLVSFKYQQEDGYWNASPEPVTVRGKGKNGHTAVRNRVQKALLHHFKQAEIVSVKYV